MAADANCQGTKISRETLINSEFPCSTGMCCHFQSLKWLKMKKKQNRILIFLTLKIPGRNYSELLLETVLIQLLCAEQKHAGTAPLKLQPDKGHMGIGLLQRVLGVAHLHHQNALIGKELPRLL